MNLEALVQLAKILPALVEIAQDARAVVTDPKVAALIDKIEAVIPELKKLA